MKKLLLILLCLPMIGFGQCVSGDCDNGYGIYIYSDGGKYIGEWRNGNWDGQGINIRPSGDKYVGEYRNFKRDGQGMYTWADGTKYVGEWRDDKKNGQARKELELIFNNKINELENKLNKIKIEYAKLDSAYRESEKVKIELLDHYEAW